MLLTKKRERHNGVTALALLFVLMTLAGSARASSLSSISTYTNPDGLVGYWDFSDHTGTSATDRGDWANTGTTSGATWVNGKYGVGLSFDGIDDYMTCTNSSVLDFNASGAFAISLWFKLGNTTLSGNDDEIISRWTSAVGQRSYAIGQSSADNKIILTTRNSADTTSTLTFTNAGINNNNRYHLVAVWNGTHTYLYLDGIMQSDVDAVTSLHASITPVLFGRMNTANFEWAGTLDEVKLWNRALSAEEVYIDYLGTYANIENYYSNSSAFSSLNSSIFLVGSNLTTFYNNLASNITNNHNAIATNLTTLQNQAVATNNSMTSYYNSLASNSTNNFNAIAKNLTDMNITLIATNKSIEAFYNGLASNSSQILELLTSLGINTTQIYNLLLGHDNNLTTDYNNIDTLIRSLANLSTSDLCTAWSCNPRTLSDWTFAQNIWDNATAPTRSLTEPISCDANISVNQTNTTNNYNTTIDNSTTQVLNITLNSTNSTENNTYYYTLDLSHPELRNISKEVVKYMNESPPETAPSYSLYILGLLVIILFIVGYTLVTRRR